MLWTNGRLDRSEPGSVDCCGEKLASKCELFRTEVIHEVLNVVDRKEPVSLDCTVALLWTEES